MGVNTRNDQFVYADVLASCVNHTLHFSHMDLTVTVSLLPVHFNRNTFDKN